jgi:hypothetical protein
MPVMIAINHQRNMKKIFRKHGASGINAYIMAVKNQANATTS